VAHRKNLEPHSAGDGLIIGRRIYTMDEEYLGVARTHWRDNDGHWIIAIDVGDDNPAFIKTDEVKIEVRRSVPALDVTDDELDARDWSLHPVDSPNRQRLRERAGWEGARDMTREPGVSEDEAEPGLPQHEDGVDYGAIPRPTTQDDDAVVYPAGSPLGRGRDTGKKDTSGSPTGGAPTAGGGQMASVGEVKAAIDAANGKVGEAQGNVAHTKETLAEAAQMYMVALDGSGHDSVSQAQASLNNANELLDQALQAMNAAIEQAGQYGASL
jgi:uncharacterized protein YukE